jgi:uncharacterized membrane protein YbhN (UPF0104 family)
VKPKLKKQFVTAIKILVSAVLIGIVFRKLDWTEIRLLLKTANPLFFSIAVLLFLGSQLVSIFRFNLFIRKVGVRLSFEANSKLYLLGMFYNFFLPGGVGGDAYKAYTLSKSHEKPLKSIGQVVFVDRFLGIVAIGFIICFLALFLKFPIPYYLNILFFMGGIIVIFIVLKFLIRLMHTHKKRIYLGFFYSVCVQLLQCICILCILKSFNVEGKETAYILMFLVSSVLSVISFAGLGIREAVFFYGAQWFQFNPDISAGVALSFSLLTAVISFMGIIYLFQKIPLKK